MREAEGEVERHVIGIVEPGENAKVGYMPDVCDETGNGPRFEGPMRSGGRLER